MGLRFLSLRKQQQQELQASCLKRWWATCAGVTLYVVSTSVCITLAYVHGQCTYLFVPLVLNTLSMVIAGVFMFQTVKPVLKLTAVNLIKTTELKEGDQPSMLRRRLQIFRRSAVLSIVCLILIVGLVVFKAEQLFSDPAAQLPTTMRTITYCLFADVINTSCTYTMSSDYLIQLSHRYTASRNASLQEKKASAERNELEPSNSSLSSESERTSPKKSSLAATLSDQTTSNEHTKSKSPSGPEVIIEFRPLWAENQMSPTKYRNSQVRSGDHTEMAGVRQILNPTFRRQLEFEQEEDDLQTESISQQSIFPCASIEPYGSTGPGSIGPGESNPNTFNPTLAGFEEGSDHESGLHSSQSQPLADIVEIVLARANPVNPEPLIKKNVAFRSER
jgi:hypothetical protein